MTIKKRAVLGIAAVAMLLPATPGPAEASCTTVMIGDQKTCLEQIPCGARDAVADQNEKVGATVRKYVAGWCYA